MAVSSPFRRSFLLEQQFKDHISSVFHASAIIDDPRVHISTGYTSKLGIGLSCFFSILSCISAILLMFIIIRSRQKLGSVYHRLMMSFACTDILFSLALAFSTLPLPTNLIYTGFKGIILGNIYTCRAQGFLRSFSSLASLICLACLAIYFLCTIRFKLSDAIFQKQMEPPMYFLMVVYPLGISITTLVLDLFHPTPYSTTCRATPYPYWCVGSSNSRNSTINVEDNMDDSCSSSSTTSRVTTAPSNMLGLQIAGSILFISTISIILVSFALIIISVYFQQREEIAATTENVGMRGELDLSTARNQVIQNRRKTRATVIHALSYVLTFAWTSSTNIYFLISDGGYMNMSYELQIADCVIRPLRGVFNLIIFVGLKVYNYRCYNPNLSFFESVKIVISGRNSDVITLSHLSLVDLDVHDRPSSSEENEMQTNSYVSSISSLLLLRNRETYSSTTTTGIRRKASFIHRLESDASDCNCGLSIDTPCGFAGGSICNEQHEEDKHELKSVAPQLHDELSLMGLVDSSINSKDRSSIGSFDDWNGDSA